MENWQRMARVGVMTTLVIAMTPSLAQGAESSTQPHNDTTGVLTGMRYHSTSEPYINLYAGPNYQGNGESIIPAQSGSFPLSIPRNQRRTPPP